MKHDEQCWKNQSIRDLGAGGPLASCTCGLDALLRVAREAKRLARSVEIYIRDADTGTLDLHDWTKMIQYSEYPELNIALKGVEDLLK